MSFSNNGIIQQFLNLLGVVPETATGQYIAYMVSAAVFAICIVAFMSLLFRFLVFLRKG